MPGGLCTALMGRQAETFSMHGPIHQHLSGGCLNMLMQLGKDLVEKQEESMPQFQYVCMLVCAHMVADMLPIGNDRFGYQDESSTLTTND